MSRLDPTFVISRLSSVKPGALVRVGERLGFAGKHATDKHALLLYNPDNFSFEYIEDDLEVINFGCGDNILIAPNLNSFRSNIENPDASHELAIANGTIPAIYYRAGDSLYRLELGGGEILKIVKTRPVSRFSEWQAGVCGADGRFAALLSIKR